MNTVFKYIGAKRHPYLSNDSSKEEVWSSSSSINHVEFEVYEDNEYSKTEADECKDRMHNMEYALDTSLGLGNKADLSEDEDEIVYGNLMVEPEERIKMLPLFKFLRIILEIVDKSFRDIRMIMSPTAQPDNLKL